MEVVSKHACSKNTHIGQAVVMHFSPSTQERGRGRWISEFETCLVYSVRFAMLLCIIMLNIGVGGGVPVLWVPQGKGNSQYTK